MTRSTPAAGGPQRGARPTGAPARRKRPWWLLALLAVAAIIVILLLVSRCGSDGDNAATSAVGSATAAAGSAVSSATSAAGSAAASVTSSAAPASTTAPPTSPSTSAAPTAGGAGGPLTANGTALLPLTTAAPDGTLSTFVGQTATATGVTVQSVPANEGFWVGSSTTDRVWVQIIGGGESPYQVTVGDKVDFTGTVLAHGGDYATIVGLPETDGATQLVTQAAHIEVPQGGVTLTR